MDEGGKLDRRTFLKRAGALGAALTLSGDGIVDKNTETTMGMETFSNDPFKSEFAKRDFIDVGEGGKAEVVDVSPKNPSEKSPIMLDPSTLVPIDVYEHVIHGFVKAGRRTLGLNHPREGGTTAVPSEDRDIAQKFSPEQVRQALTDIKVLDTKNIDDVTMLGHSQRGVSSALAALLMVRREKRGEGKQRIKNVVLFESAGLIQDDSRARLAGGFLAEPSTRGAWGASFDAIPDTEDARLQRDAENAKRAAEGREPIVRPEYGRIEETAEDKAKGAVVRGGQRSEFNASPTRAFKEMWGLAATDLLPILKELRESGVGVIVIAGASDRVFPMEKIVGELTQNGEEKLGGLRSEHVDMFLPFRGDHALRVPQVPYIEGWLTAFEEKQKRSVETR